jgi:hypothetical protein
VNETLYFRQEVESTKEKALKIYESQQETDEEKRMILLIAK